ncbi:alanine racemase [Janibacter massiliensis]|uniref:alanine racemase n=1 Tax=Janibacter massiliensis TaxID=2058291 RepID=UPI000D0EEA6E|nr:alanine racemase [Janibacter massiliensis]
MISWDAATEGLQAPFALVDLDAFDANGADLARRAGGVPVRVASKSVRCRGLLRRALSTDGFAGVMAYTVREAIWLAGGPGGAADDDPADPTVSDDVYVAYPSVDVAALAEVAADEVLRERVTITIDSPEHVRFLAAHALTGLRVAVDVDASLKVGPAHLGARRSPVREPADAVEVVVAAQTAGLRVVGLMFYDAQIAGVPDSSLAVRAMKRRSHAALMERRHRVVEAVSALTELAFVNGGGTGSLHLTGTDPCLTELAAGSGFLAPALFDGYGDFAPRPCAAFALPVVRRPGPGFVTVLQGGYLASGAPGASRLPTIHSPAGLQYLGAEGAGEVQTPLRGAVADTLSIGDRVWFRHAKAGELCERFEALHLVSGGRVVGSLPTYRGEGRCFG